MKSFKIYAFLTFLFLGSTSVSAQSMLKLYFGGNKDSLINEVTKLINRPVPQNTVGEPRKGYHIFIASGQVHYNFQSYRGR